MKKIKILMILFFIQSHTIYTLNTSCGPCSVDDNFSGCAPCRGTSNASDCTIPCGPKTYFQPRSQGANTARELVGWQDKIYLYDVFNYVSSAAAFEYQTTFKNFRLAREYFGSEILSFVGSQVPDREIEFEPPFCNFLADNFGLSTLYNGRIKLSPKIENYILDFEFYIALDSWADGLYFRIHAPLTYTRWTLHGHQDICVPQNNAPLPACYFSSDAVQPFTTIEEALKGDGFGDVPERKFGKFCFGTNKKFRLADIDLILGYNFWITEFSHFGAYVQAVVPTGNKPNPKFIFSPIVGNGKHWELGAGFSAHRLLWESGVDQSLKIYAEGNVTHLFKNRQLRSFDLCSGPFSRYLILKEFEADEITYKGLITAIDVTTQLADITIALKADISIKLSYHHNNFGIDFGYNIYGHTRETLHLVKNQLECDNRKFGIKGTQGICCQEYNTAAGIIGTPTGNSSSLNSTENSTTICNPGPIDNPSEVFISPDTICVSWDNTATTGDSISSALIAQDSNPPIIISSRNINPCSGASCQLLTSKIFAHLNYSWFESSYLPHIGVGAEIEIDGRADVNKGANYWGIWIKGGLTF